MVAPLCALSVEVAPSSKATAAVQFLTRLLIIALVDLGGWKPETGRACPDINVYCIGLPFIFVHYPAHGVGVHSATERTECPSVTRGSAFTVFSKTICWATRQFVSRRGARQRRCYNRMLE